MLDINAFREEKGGDPEQIRISQRKRGADVSLVDKIISLDREWVKLRFTVDQINKDINAVQKEIGQKMKNKENADELLAKKQQLTLDKELGVKQVDEKYSELQRTLAVIGNIVHESVVDSKDEAHNAVIRTWSPDNSTPVKGENILAHHQVLQRLEGYEPERGAAIAGHRGYFLRNWGVRLNQAMINYGLDFLHERGYTLLQTPFFMKREIMAKTAQLEEFDEALYKVSGDGEDDKYLIATSEQPISAFHMNEFIEELPLRYGGISTCFRKEAGAHGKDTWGLFRIHQFEKVEQFVLTDPDQSWEMFDEMIATSEAFFQSLGLSYRVVSIVSGALNNAAAKKYDLEAWFPNYGQFKELVSCSNCTDYQSRNLDIKCAGKKGATEKRFVHCLNSTLCATERALCCILENYQTPEGLRVPEKLRPYLGGVDFIPFTAPLKPTK